MLVGYLIILYFLKLKVSSLYEYYFFICMLLFVFYDNYICQNKGFLKMVSQ